MRKLGGLLFFGWCLYLGSSLWGTAGMVGFGVFGALAGLGIAVGDRKSSPPSTAVSEMQTDEWKLAHTPKP